MASTSRFAGELYRQGYSGKVGFEIEQLYKEPYKRARRDRYEILAEILQVCRRPCGKTRVMYKASLSYAQVVGCIESLRMLELWEIIPEPQQDQTTKKGLEFLRRYAYLRELLKTR